MSSAYVPEVGNRRAILFGVLVGVLCGALIIVAVIAGRSSNGEPGTREGRLTFVALDSRTFHPLAHTKIVVASLPHSVSCLTDTEGWCSVKLSAHDDDVIEVDVYAINYWPHKDVARISFKKQDDSPQVFQLIHKEPAPK